MSKIYLIYVLLPIISFCAAFFMTQKERRKEDLYFILAMVAAIVAEILGIVIPYFGKSNYIVYNIYMLVSSVLIFQIYRNLLTSKNKNVEITLSILYLCVLFLFENANCDIFNENFDNFILLANIPLLYLILKYLIQLIYSEKVLGISNERFFWISLGFLLFLVPYSLISLIHKFIVREFEYARATILFLNFMLHICFLKAYLWKRTS